jgi:hypothetical protein
MLNAIIGQKVTLILNGPEIFLQTGPTAVTRKNRNFSVLSVSLGVVFSLCYVQALIREIEGTVECKRTF